MVVYFEGTDGIGHVFASFEPPRMACVSEADFARYHRAVDEYYALVDRMIGQWMRRAEEDGATLVVNSDHGFKWGEDRPCERSSLNPSTAAFWHRLDGVFAAWGPRVRRGQPRGAATVFDVAPTVSALLGLPVDRAVRGGVIAGAFEGLVRAAEEGPLRERSTSGASRPRPCPTRKRATTRSGCATSGISRAPSPRSWRRRAGSGPA